MSGTSNPNEQQQAMAFAVMQSPQIVFNAFANGLSASEITSLLSFGPRPLVTLIMAPSVAKTFALSLLESVEKYEQATGSQVPTIQELSDRLTAYQLAHAP